MSDPVRSALTELEINRLASNPAVAWATFKPVKEETRMKCVRFSLCLAAMLGELMVSTDPATAQQEIPVIKTIPGFAVIMSRVEDFSADYFTLEEDRKRKEKTANGKHWTLAYA